MPDVILYSHNKASNSTRLPTGGTTVTAQWFASFSIQNPKLVFHFDFPDNPSQYNYCYIQDFNRYYYIENWDYAIPNWIGQLKVDVMTTYKSQIGSTTSYILRSASASNMDVVDSTYPCVSTANVVVNTGTNSWVTDLSQCVYSIGVIGATTTYYLCSALNLGLFLLNIFSDIYITQICPDFATVYPQARIQVNPLQYISSIIAIPFSGLDTSPDAQLVPVGFAKIPSPGKIITSPVMPIYRQFSIPVHPQISRGNFLKLAPYTQHTLYIPPWGLISLDSTIMSQATSIYTQIFLDQRLGTATLAVGTEQFSNILSSMSIQLGINVQVAQVVAQGYGLMQGLSSAVSGVASLASGNFSGAANALFGAIGDAAAGQIPSVSSLGSNGGFDAVFDDGEFKSVFRLIADADVPNRGYPLCRRVQISSLSGFVLPSDIKIEISGTRSELDELTSIMEGGFFYE